MNSPGIPQRLLIVAMATLLLSLSGTMAWAAVNDFGSRGLVPNGVTIAGTDLSGMTESEARDAIEKAIAAPLMRPVTVEADGKTFSFDPRDAVTIDVESMLAAAYEPRRSASYLGRLQDDLVGTTTRVEVEPAYAVDDAVLKEWLVGVARKVNLRAVDATVTVKEGKLVIRRSRAGRRTDLAAATKVLSEAFASDRALTADDRSVTIPVAVVRPRVDERRLDKTIFVDLSKRKIWLYDGVKIEKTYPCAVGTGSYPTPTGEFEIVLKRYMPTWSNPAPNGWGAGMPAYIGPGPSNPLGTRALNLSASGIRFHGTTKRWSVGTAASHGCMRMLREDIEDFYERVDVGTKVFIVP